MSDDPTRPDAEDLPPPRRGSVWETMSANRKVVVLAIAAVGSIGIGALVVALGVPWPIVAVAVVIVLAIIVFEA